MKALAALALALTMICAAASSHAADTPIPSFLQTGQAYMFFTDNSMPAITGTLRSTSSYPWICVEVTTKHGCWMQWLNMAKVSSVRPVSGPISCPGTPKA